MKEMSAGGRVLDDCTYREGIPVPQENFFADRILFSKIFFRHGFREDHVFRVRQTGGRIAVNESMCKNVEKIGIRKCCMIFVKAYISDPEQYPACVLEAGEGFNLGIFGE